MKNAIRKTMLVTASTTLITALAGCGGSTTDEGKENGTPANSPVTLTMEYNWSTPNVDNTIYKERIKKFQELNPNIKIEAQDIPSAQYRTKLRTEAAGNSMPDMFILYPGIEMDPYIAADVLMPIDEIMSNWKDILPEQALAGYKVNGKQYAIPTKMTFVDIVYYHKDMLAKAGYKEFPKTYDEFLDLVKKLKDSGVTPLAMGNKNRWPMQSTFMSAVGDRFTGSDFLPKVNKGEAKFTDPDYVKSLSVISDLVKLDAFNADINTMDEVQQQDYFLQKKAAMTMTSSTIDAKFRGSNSDKAAADNIGIALFPAVNGGKGDPTASAGVIQYGIGLSKSLSGAKKDAAMKFLQYFYQPELYQTLMSKGIVVPAKVEVPADASPYLKEMLALTKNGSAPVFDSVMPAAVKDVLENGIQAITTKQKTAEQLAKDMQDAQDKSKK
ncbi:extracellular solute-binding protein [Paenibacillus aurantius]|uniref:Extracellular solute-binding protein n=1 Tax=Paenibacillus aurantius TaxID=2918900 RepID=A0AA96LL43_9BACL|nr:extracellular solute-binding protein [Paenibacillus aurantius]WJH33634.1 extracellular solute-binding protein [Paenibacillus sp. CC-CFT747]WNQ14086.1 extracellular solute-binding protein [Paenibacillus aurantius]